MKSMLIEQIIQSIAMIEEMTGYKSGKSIEGLRNELEEINEEPLMVATIKITKIAIDTVNEIKKRYNEMNKSVLEVSEWFERNIEMNEALSLVGIL